MLVIQVQRDRPEFNGRALDTLSDLIGSLVAPASWHCDHDVENHATNFQIESDDAADFWSRLVAQLSAHPADHEALSQCWIVVCEGDASWDDYVQLAHYDDSMPGRS
ncbi:hypothetical protein BH10PSE17_BH10PSE17_26300 [soil metagenome]